MPADGPDRPQVVTRHSLRESRRKLRILLAEDNKVNQLVAARLLGKRGHTVVIAENGREALAALDAPGSADFDLILMDVQMPDMDGFEATAAHPRDGEILRRPPADHRHDRPRHERRRERCLAAGMDGYVSKPIDVEQLFIKIDSVLVQTQGQSTHSRTI